MSRGKASANYLHREGLVGHETAADWGFLYETSLIKSSKWEIGDRTVLPDGRIFRYAKVTSGGEAYAGQGCSFENVIAISGSCAAAQVIGDSQITFASQTFSVDELRGGYIVIYSSDNSNVQQRGIIGNTVASSSTVTIYLDAPLVANVAAAKFCEVLHNPYSSVKTRSGEQDGYVSIAGVAAVEATALKYVWIQTWGPCWVPPGEAGVGGVTSERQLVFAIGGAVHPHNAAHATTKQQQHAGFIIQRDSSSNDGPPFVMLQISV